MDDASRRQLFCVIPAFRAAATIADVVAQALRYAQSVVVVDDGMPQRTGAVAAHGICQLRQRVRARARTQRRCRCGNRRPESNICLERGADVIVKLDADGQMDPAFSSRPLVML